MSFCPYLLSLTSSPSPVLLLEPSSPCSSNQEEQLSLLPSQIGSYQDLFSQLRAKILQVVNKVFPSFLAEEIENFYKNATSSTPLSLKRVTIASLHLLEYAQAYQKVNFLFMTLKARLGACKRQLKKIQPPPSSSPLNPSSTEIKDLVIFTKNRTLNCVAKKIKEAESLSKELQKKQSFFFSDLNRLFFSRIMNTGNMLDEFCLFDENCFLIDPNQEKELEKKSIAYQRWAMGGAKIIALWQEFLCDMAHYKKEILKVDDIICKWRKAVAAQKPRSFSTTISREEPLTKPLVFHSSPHLQKLSKETVELRISLLMNAQYLTTIINFSKSQNQQELLLNREATPLKESTKTSVSFSLNQAEKLLFTPGNTQEYLHLMHKLREALQVFLEVPSCKFDKKSSLGRVFFLEYPAWKGESCILQTLAKNFFEEATLE